MKPYHLGFFVCVEVTIDRIANICSQGVQIVCFGKYGFTQSPGVVTALDSILDQKYYFIHGNSSIPYLQTV
jgi:hypothetical protein